jgi:transposase
MARTKPKESKSRLFFSVEFKQEAVQMLLDGHSAPSVAERLGHSGPNALCRWKGETPQQAGPTARTLGERVDQFEDELRRVERERNIFIKALAILTGMRSRHVCRHRTTLPPWFFSPVFALRDARGQPDRLLRSTVRSPVHSTTEA